MLKFIGSTLAALALLSPLAAYADCRTYTIVDTRTGRVIFCTECCYGSGYARTCNVTCN